MFLHAVIFCALKEYGIKITANCKTRHKLIMTLRRFGILRTDLNINPCKLGGRICLEASVAAA